MTASTLVVLLIVLLKLQIKLLSRTVNKTLSYSQNGLTAKKKKIVTKADFDKFVENLGCEFYHDRECSYNHECKG